MRQTNHLYNSLTELYWQTISFSTKKNMVTSHPCFKYLKISTDHSFVELSVLSPIFKFCSPRGVGTHKFRDRFTPKTRGFSGLKDVRRFTGHSILWDFCRLPPSGLASRWGVFWWEGPNVLLCNGYTFAKMKPAFNLSMKHSFLHMLDQKKRNLSNYHNNSQTCTNTSIQFPQPCCICSKSPSWNQGKILGSFFKIQPRLAVATNTYLRSHRYLVRKKH